MADKQVYATDETQDRNIQQTLVPPCHLLLPLQLLPAHLFLHT